MVHNEDDQDTGPAEPPGRLRGFGKQASFGGVASLFATARVANKDIKVVNTSPKQQKQPGTKGGARKKRFEGVTLHSSFFISY